MNSKIQWIKQMACGYRNRQRFHNGIYFHLGGLNLYPNALSPPVPSLPPSSTPACPA
jgi:hypothetical protein